MMYENLIQDFAKRTLANLDLMRSLAQQHPEVQLYETTQLINSMLGLLIFPQQSLLAKVPEVPLADLERAGWPVPRVTGKFEQVKDLKALIRYLRNAISHCNVKFKADKNEQIVGLVVWNKDTRRSKCQTTWKAELSLEDIEKITRKFIELILTSEHSN